MLPFHPFLIFWNQLMVILMFYVATFLPFSICFFKESNTNHGFEIFDTIIDFMFLIDICINFISSYDNPETHLPEVRLKMIALNYITGFFFIDIIAIFPFQLIDHPDPKAIQVARVTKLYRLLRVFRLVKILRILR